MLSCCLDEALASRVAPSSLGCTDFCFFCASFCASTSRCSAILSSVLGGGHTRVSWASAGSLGSQSTAYIKASRHLIENKSPIIPELKEARDVGLNITLEICGAFKTCLPSMAIMLTDLYLLRSLSPGHHHSACKRHSPFPWRRGDLQNVVLIFVWLLHAVKK